MGYSGVVHPSPFAFKRFERFLPDGRDVAPGDPAQRGDGCGCPDLSQRADALPGKVMACIVPFRLIPNSTFETVDGDGIADEAENLGDVFDIDGTDLAPSIEHRAQDRGHGSIRLMVGGQDIRLETAPVRSVRSLREARDDAYTYIAEAVHLLL